MIRHAETHRRWSRRSAAPAQSKKPVQTTSRRHTHVSAWPRPSEACPRNSTAHQPPHSVPHVSRALSDPNFTSKSTSSHLKVNLVDHALRVFACAGLWVVACAPLQATV